MNIPGIGFGTFRLTGKVAYEAVSEALKAGYRHIDTAQLYDNEVEVGRAIADSDVAREDVYVTTKVQVENLSKELFIDSVKESLSRLNMAYVDLLLIHWPAPPEGTTLNESMALLHECKRLDLTRQIGVSNFNIALLKEVSSVVPLCEIATNQVEVHPYLTNQKLIAYCEENHIPVTAYMPFAVGEVLKDDVVKSIAERLGASPAQVVIAWTQAKGLITIPSSTKASNIRGNLAGMSVELTESDVSQIDALHKNYRIADIDIAPEWD